MSSRSRHKVAVLAIDAVIAFDLSIAAQALGHPDEALYALEVCGVRAGRVPTTTGFALDVPHGLEALARADTVVVPGYDPRGGGADAKVLAALRAASSRGARVVSICTGAFALAAAGLLDGRRATTHWQHAAALARRFGAVTVDPDVLFVDEGRVMTSAGVAAGIDLCLHLVRSDHGAAAANAVARRMVVAPVREGGQAQFLERPLPERGGGLAATRAWMLERLGEPLTVAGCARHAGWSERSFARHFAAETGTSPLRWLHAQRVLEARRLLEETGLAVEEVARRSGFGTAATLRAHFRRATASTPSGYRSAWLRVPGPGVPMG